MMVYADEVENSETDEFILIVNRRMPTHNFANVVVLITDKCPCQIRGSECLSSPQGTTCCIRPFGCISPPISTARP